VKLKIPGVPQATALRRYAPGQPLVEGPVLLAPSPVAADNSLPLVGRVGEGVSKLLERAGVSVLHSLPLVGRVGEGVSSGESSPRWSAIMFDATGIADVAGLSALHAAIAPAFRYLRPSGRLIVFGTPPEDSSTPAQAAAQRALDGFVRSAGKEARLGSTANLIYVADGAESGLESTLRFFVSGRSAYVDGQVIRLRPAKPASTPDWDHPLKDRVAVVTGAARGIGAAIAETLARDGAQVVVLDVPAQGAALAEVANRVGGNAFQVDITATDAPAKIAVYLNDRQGGADIFVHNAGITRDRSLVNMPADQWASVLAVNLDAQLRINEALLSDRVLHPGARVICISSTSGIAGNRGQTNYAASKAGIIGMVQAMAPELAKQDMTINAVAPGFIETAMTKAMPLATREIGRRINSLNQGGLPVDVAETVAWLGQPGTGGVNGEVIRVCGQSILGA
jgi:3-oxoacyl-[acyl-carrier protein] reductase